MSSERSRGWLVDIALGVVAGGLVGAIVAVNFVIYVGIDRGYEASLVDVFRQSPVAGVITVLLLLGGPALGVWLARRRRNRPSRTEEGIPGAGVHQPR